MKKLSYLLIVLLGLSMTVAVGCGDEDDEDAGTSEDGETSEDGDTTGDAVDINLCIQKFVGHQLGCMPPWINATDPPCFTEDVFTKYLATFREIVVMSENSLARVLSRANMYESSR